LAEIELLDSEERIAAIDKSDMLSVVGSMPEMVSQAEKFSLGVDFPRLKGIKMS
jgi:hypothetical protein